MAGKLRTCFYGSDATAEAARRSRALKPDISLAENVQMFRHTIQFERPGLDERGELAQARHIGNQRTRVQVQIDALALQRVRATFRQLHLDRLVKVKCSPFMMSPAPSFASLLRRIAIGSSTLLRLCSRTGPDQCRILAAARK